MRAPVDERDPAKAGGRSWLLSVEELKWSDRISATLINRRARREGEELPLYSNVQSGVIFAPAATKVLCAFSKDGSTQSDRVCDPPGVSARCVPGCSYHGRLTWCGQGNDRNCAWQPNRLGSMLEEQSAMHNRGPTDRYNEVRNARHFRA